MGKWQIRLEDHVGKTRSSLALNVMLSLNLKILGSDTIRSVLEGPPLLLFEI